jgi:AmiR/NasT family two-component response regulator
VQPGALGGSTIRIAQAMADVATIGLLQARVISRSELLAEQLQRALHGRVLIEQAKGVLAERMRIDMNQAFEMLRRYARTRNLFISVVAEAVIGGAIDIRTLSDKTADSPK